MTLLTWKNACQVGVRAFDDQHGILMESMNEVRQALVRGAGREEVAQVLDRLIEFSRLHFSAEERLLEQYGFPQLPQHRHEHGRLLAQVIEAAHRVQHGEALQMRPLLEFLREWYCSHIEHDDHAYGPWLNDRGVF